MHRDLLKALLLLVVHRLVSYAQPAPDPWRTRTGRSRSRRLWSGYDVTPALFGESDSARSGQLTPATCPAAEVTASGAAGEPGRRGRRRGGRGRGRRRGRRAGRVWARRDDDRNSLLVSHINIQSLKNKTIDLRQELSLHGFDAVSVNETWLRKSTTNIMAFPGYKLLRSDRTFKPYGFGGVAVLARESLNPKIVSKPAAVCDSKLESVWTELRVGHNRTVLFCSLYRRPSKTESELNRDLDELENQVQSALGRYSGLVMFCGDLNCNVRVTDGAGGKLTQLLSRYGLYQCVKPGSVTYRPSASKLDVIFTNHGDRVVRSGTLLCHFSPHNFVRCQLRVKKERGPPAAIMCRSFSRVNWDALRLDLTLIDWDRMRQCSTLEHQSQLFNELFIAVFNHHAPVRRVTLKHSTALPLTAETIQLLDRRRAATRDGCQLTYALLNRRCRAAIRQDCRNDVIQKLREQGPTATWRVARSLLSDGGGVSRPTPLVSVDCLNAYFSSIGVRTSASVISTHYVPILLTRISTCSFCLSAVSYRELRRVVTSLRNTNTCGVDGISSRMVKNTFNVIGHIILNLVNASLTRGTVPESWKISLVYPIHKGGALDDPAQFRPISVVPLVSKITERVVQEQLYMYFSEQDLFSPAQHAYRRNHSTQTALLTVSDYILSAMNRREIVLIAMLDCSKCFDTIDHGTLLSVLRLYGVDTTWFASYLSGHSQRVQVNSGGKIHTSQLASNPTGIYQGTALGPLLFSIFSNDMHLHIDPSVRLVQYADDSQIAVCGKKEDLPQLISRLEATLATVHKWFASRKMKINAAKTQLVTFGTKQLLQGLPPIQINFGGETITETSKVRNLGLTMDRHMTFRPHLDQVTGTCTGVLLGLAAARHWLPRDVMVMLVNALVLSRVRYCLAVYGNASSEVRDRIQKIINFCARAVTGRSKRDHVSDAIRSLEWLRATSLYQYSTITAFRAVITCGEPLSLAANISVHEHCHNTRRAGQYRPTSVRTELGKRMFAYSAPTLYNELPQAVRETGAGGFKRVLKNHLIDCE